MAKTRNKISLPRYNLKEINSKDETLIYLIYRYKTDSNGSRVRLKYSTGKKINPKFWKGQLAKESLSYKGHRQLNIFLRDLKSEVQRIVTKEPLIALDKLKYRLDQFNGYTEVIESRIPTLIEYIEEYIAKVDRDKRTIKKNMKVLRIN